MVQPTPIPFHTPVSQPHGQCPGAPKKAKQKKAPNDYSTGQPRARRRLQF